MDRRDWWTAVYRVGEKQTQLSEHIHAHKYKYADRDKSHDNKGKTEIEKKKKKGLNDPDNHDGMITHLEPDSLE